MKSTKQPITGKESKSDNFKPVCALIDFYHAFNNKNHEQVKQNWLITDEISMSNPLGGLKRGWDEIKEVYRRIFDGPANVYVEFYDYTIYPAAEMFVAVGREEAILNLTMKFLNYQSEQAEFTRFITSNGDRFITMVLWITHDSWRNTKQFY